MKKVYDPEVEEDERLGFEILRIVALVALVAMIFAASLLAKSEPSCRSYARWVSENHWRSNGPMHCEPGYRLTTAPATDGYNLICSCPVP